MAFLAPEAIALAPEVGLGITELGGEAVAGAEGFFGGIGRGFASLGKNIFRIGSKAEGSAATTLEPSVARVGLTRTAVPKVTSTVEQSAKTIFSKLPKLKTTTKVIAGGLALDAGGNFIQNLRDENQTLKQALMNVPGGMVHDVADLTNYGGKQAGYVLGQGVKGASEGVFGNSDMLWELALLGGGLYLFTR